jgi:hypothetical protein
MEVLRDICRRRSIEDGGEKIKIRFLMKNLGKNELQFKDLKWKKQEEKEIFSVSSTMRC